MGAEKREASRVAADLARRVRSTRIKIIYRVSTVSGIAIIQFGVGIPYLGT